MEEKNKDKEKIKKMEERIEELENNWKRALADYKNLEKRTAEERESFINYANESLIRTLLPVLDNMELMVKHFEDEGLRMILQDLKKTLMNENVTEVEALGNEFNAVCMDAIETVEGDEGIVIEVITKGYLLKNKLLRPARVKVGKGKQY